MAATTGSNPDFDLAVQYVCHTAKPVFLTGKAGTGKTTFLKYIREHCQKKMAVVAPTGVAAINAGGVTMHSFFQLPLGPYIAEYSGGWGVTQMEWANRHTLLKNLRINSNKKKLIRELELLIIDEVSMLRADMLDAIDTVLRHVRQRPAQAFGGIQVLFIGDLYQLPPVVGREEWQLLSAHYKSPFFFDAQVLRDNEPVSIELKQIYRQQDPAFIRVLNAIRNNELGPDDLQQLHQRYQPDFQPPAGQQYIMLASHNARADRVNKEELDKLGGRLHVFEGQVKGDFGEKVAPVDKHLLLKEGAQIMFVKNDKGENRRYYNGKIGTVSKIDADQILVHFAAEDSIMELEKETWRNISYRYDPARDEVEEEELGSFTQYPVRLAWAITIHKSQGLTFERAIVDAGASFAPGQVYVALSRLTSMEGLVLHTRISPGQVMTDERVVQYASRAGTGAQDRLLQEEQRQYVSGKLRESFDMEALPESFAELSTALQAMAIPEKEKAIALLRQLVLTVRSLQEIAGKFTRQLELLLPQDGSLPDYGLLRERSAAAAAYFGRELDAVVQLLEDHTSAWKLKPRTKKYTAELLLLRALCTRKKEELVQAAVMAEGLQDGADIGQLLQKLVKTKTAEPASPASESPAKKEKGSSNRQSLDLYQSGKSIAEIAELRSMAVSTVEGHLVSFIGTGEIAVSAFVQSEQLSLILRAIQQHGMHAGTLKEQLGSACTYTQIRAVVAYHQRLAREG